MVRLYIINIDNTDYYNFAESVNISLYLKSLEKYSPFPINKDYLNYNINPEYEKLQTLITTDEPFYFVRLIQIQFQKYHLQASSSNSPSQTARACSQAAPRVDVASP